MVQGIAQDILCCMNLACHANIIALWTLHKLIDNMLPQLHCIVCMNSASGDAVNICMQAPTFRQCGLNGRRHVIQTAHILNVTTES